MKEREVQPHLGRLLAVITLMSLAAAFVFYWLEN
jgi:hypothetical protein